MSQSSTSLFRHASCSRPLLLDTSSNTLSLATVSVSCGHEWAFFLVFLSLPFSFSFGFLSLSVLFKRSLSSPPFCLVGVGKSCLLHRFTEDKCKVFLIFGGCGTGRAARSEAKEEKVCSLSQS